MPQTILTNAIEKSTYIITAVFTDSAGDSVIPDTITWSLVDEDEAYINSRQDVSVAVPAASVDIVLSGDDLVFDDTGDAGEQKRYFVIEATYTAAEGAGLPLKDHALFYLSDLKKVM